MTLYPDDTVDYFYPFTTWGSQPVIIRDDSNEATVILNEKVPNETYLHITAKEFDAKLFSKSSQSPCMNYTVSTAIPPSVGLLAKDLSSNFFFYWQVLNLTH